MTPEQALASHRRFLTDRFTVTRNNQGATTALATAINVQGRIIDYTLPRGSAHDNVQGYQKAVVLVQDLIDQSFPVPMKTGDVIGIQGRTVRVIDVDQNTRKVGQTVIAFECLVKGS